MVIIVKPTEKFLRETTHFKEKAIQSWGILIPYIEDEEKLNLSLQKIYPQILQNELKNILSSPFSLEQFKQFFEIEICYKVFVSNDILNKNTFTH